MITENILSTLLRVPIDYAIIGSDLKGNIVLWNEGAFQLYGYQAQEIVGKVNLSRLEKSHAKSKSKIVTLIAQVLENAQWEGEMEFAPKEGQNFVARVIIMPYYNERQPEGIVMIVKRLSNQLVERIEYQEKFGHESRTQLNAIIGFTGTLLMKFAGPLNEAQEKQLQSIQKSAHNLLSLINNL